MGLGTLLQSRALRICIAYALISMTISMTYKAVLSGYKYDSKFLMLSEQLAAALVFCAVAKRSLVGVPGLEVPDFSSEVLKKSALSGTLFVVNIVVGWYGLQLVSIPLFLCIRRTTTAFTLVTEYFILGRTQSRAVMAAVLLIMLGALIAGWEALQSDWRGIGYTMANNVMTAVAMTVTKRFSDRHKSATTGFGMVYYNALVALPLSLAGATLFGEWSYNMQYPRIMEPGFWVAIALASVMGLLMTYIALLCSTVNSPLVTSITGNVKDIAATVVGALVFGDFHATRYSVGGIVLSFVGAGLFSYAKLKETGGLGGGSAPAAGAVAGKIADAAPGSAAPGGGGASPGGASPAGALDGAAAGGAGSSLPVGSALTISAASSASAAGDSDEHASLLHGGDDRGGKASPKPEAGAHLAGGSRWAVGPDDEGDVEAQSLLRSSPAGGGGSVGGSAEVSRRTSLNKDQAALAAEDGLTAGRGGIVSKDALPKRFAV